MAVPPAVALQRKQIDDDPRGPTSRNPPQTENDDEFLSG